MRFSVTLLLVLLAAFALPGLAANEDVTRHADGTYSVCPSIMRAIYSATIPPGYVSVQSKGFLGLKKEADFVDSDTALKNPRRNLVKTSKGMRLKFQEEEIVNAEMNFVVSANNTFILDTMHPVRHPNMVGGVDPRVRAAGGVVWKDGLIYEVYYRRSGHFKPGVETKDIVINSFKNEFPPEMFHPEFKGYSENISAQ